MWWLRERCLRSAEAVGIKIPRLHKPRDRVPLGAGRRLDPAWISHASINPWAMIRSGQNDFLTEEIRNTSNFSQGSRDNGDYMPGVFLKGSRIPNFSAGTDKHFTYDFVNPRTFEPRPGPQGQIHVWGLFPACGRIAITIVRYVHPMISP